MGLVGLSGPAGTLQVSIRSVRDQTIGAQSRILLREAGEDSTPLVRPLTPLTPLTKDECSGREGRYQVVGEIGRGGSGVVLKGRDVALGRDVAMKVLRPDHAAQPEMVLRLVEEAQIGGQLQPDRLAATLPESRCLPKRSAGYVTMTWF